MRFAGLLIFHGLPYTVTLKSNSRGTVAFDCCGHASPLGADDHQAWPAGCKQPIGPARRRGRASLRGGGEVFFGGWEPLLVSRCQSTLLFEFSQNADHLLPMEARLIPILRQAPV